MKTKKQLRIELEKARNEIKGLRADVERLTKDRTNLANELSDPIKKADRELYLALTNNLTKSLNQKNAVNMKPDEKDAVYYLLGRRVEIRQADDSQCLASPFLYSPIQSMQASWVNRASWMNYI